MADHTNFCCPGRELGVDGKCTECHAELLSEPHARYLHLLRDEIDARLTALDLPHDGVRIIEVSGAWTVVTIPPAWAHEMAPDWVDYRVRSCGGRS